MHAVDAVNQPKTERETNNLDVTNNCKSHETIKSDFLWDVAITIDLLWNLHKFHWDHYEDSKYDTQLSQ